MTLPSGSDIGMMRTGTLPADLLNKVLQAGLEKRANSDMVMFSGESRRHFVPQTWETVSSLPLTRPVSPHPQSLKGRD